MEKNFLMFRAIRRGNRLPREAARVLSLEARKLKPDTSLQEFKL